MQPISYNNNVSYAPNFRGLLVFDRVLIDDKGKISKKTAKLVAALNEQISKEWKNIKMSGNKDKTPIFFSRDRRKITSVKPVYSQKYPALLVEQENGKYTENIIIDRYNPNNFKYEKIVETPYGSATLRSYDSRICNDKEINTRVDNILYNCLDDIITKETMRTFFDDELITVGDRLLAGQIY